MAGQENLMKQVDDLIELMRADTVEFEAAQQAASKIAEMAKDADVEMLDDAVARLAALIPELKIIRAGLIAITCGALVEEGASAEPVAEPVLTRFSEAAQRTAPFVEACLAEATAAQASDGEESDELDAEEAIERFGERVSERMPDAAQAIGALEWLSAATLTILARSKVLRQQVNSDVPLVQAIAYLADLGFELPCFHEMLSMLDDEELVVLHPGLARGYIIRIAGIGDNFQLHTLLADALIGDPEQGWLPGERPSPEVAALAKDAPIADSDEPPIAYGAFNLWNWTGLSADSSLPEGHAGSDHWIWNEGVPADIVPFQGTRVILIGPPPYARSWNSGRFFPAIPGELEVVRHMSADEVRDWLDRLASAPRPTPEGRDISTDGSDGSDDGDDDTTTDSALEASES